jgi:hypothetical protein
MSDTGSSPLLVTLKRRMAADCPSDAAHALVGTREKWGKSMFSDYGRGGEKTTHGAGRKGILTRATPGGEDVLSRGTNLPSCEKLMLVAWSSSTLTREQRCSLDLKCAASHSRIVRSLLQETRCCWERAGGGVECGRERERVRIWMWGCGDVGGRVRLIASDRERERIECKVRV